MVSRHMSQTIDLSSSMTLINDRAGIANKDHFKWSSIKTFLYLSFAFSSTTANFDMFSKVVHNVRIFDFIFFEIFLGMTYMCMDFFIKQYTRKLAFNISLNPLLKGITYGILLQSGLWTVIHASDLSDSVTYIFHVLQATAQWAKCPSVGMEFCVTPTEVIRRCRSKLQVTDFNITSSHLNYRKTFSIIDRNFITTKLLASASVWIANFLFSAVTDETLLKIIKLTFLWRLLSTGFMFTLLVSTTDVTSEAFMQMMNISAPSSVTQTVDQVAYAYGIGFVGVYDFGLMSPFTMVDNAVVIYGFVFTTVSFARSLMVKNLYMMLRNCVKVKQSITSHYLMYAVLPLTTEFLNVHRLYIFYLYGNIMITAIAYLSMITLSMTKLLQTRFRSIKNIYIVGVLCFLGFGCSVPISMVAVVDAGYTGDTSVGMCGGIVPIISDRIKIHRGNLLLYAQSPSSRIGGLLYGLNVTILYLGGVKVAIIMWVYGIRRFSTDIHFWLGFKPTKFWTLCWFLLPLFLFGFVIDRIYKLTQMTDTTKFIAAVCWIVISMLITNICIIKTIAKYLIANNLVGAFKSSKRYGPPDSEDRLARKKYNETIRLRQCSHSCIVLDSTYECHHTENLETDSNESFTQDIMTVSTTSRRARPSSIMAVDTDF